MDIKVKYVEDEDYSTIVKLLKENEIMGMPEDIISRGYYSPAAIKQRVQMGMETILVAKQGDTTCGFIIVSTGVSDDISAIPIVLVDPQHRRKGVASILVEKTIEELKKVGSHKLYANVHYRNKPSLMLFTKTGFIPEVYMRDMYLLGEHVIVYAYYLDEP
ncbi:MAG: GNAT family N-acetyltransferase [Theionarchaea archaeon]|nr:GNAT family N-acetyltransferase [Theionarchaea archaeon]